jgi:hypothetical protein
MWHAWERREKCTKFLVGKPEGKRPLGRPRRRWEDGIRMDLRETGLGGVDWIRLAQDRDRWRAVVSAVPMGSCATELVIHKAICFYRIRKLGSGDVGCVDC